MNLGFTQTINNKPTFFIEKIWASLLRQGIIGYAEYLKLHYEKFNKGWDNENSCLWPNEEIDGKEHTIRDDLKNKWKAGNLIHPIINNRTPKRFQFAPVIKCISVQPIKIKWHELTETAPVRWCNVLVATGHGSYKLLGCQSIEHLAKNDGFESVEAFFAWFNKDFTGKIIHWTNLRY